MEIINVHAHIYPDRIAQKATEAIGAFYSERMENAVGTAQRLIADGSAAGITKYAIHSVATTACQVRSINDFIKTQTDIHPEFIGFITLHQDLSEDEKYKEISHALQNGLRGIKLHPDFQKFDIDSQEADMIYSFAEGKLPILMHVGDDRYDHSAPVRLANAAQRHPDTIFIAAHFGAYRCWQEAEIYRGLDNVYFDTCSSLSYIGPDRAKELISIYGAERFLFGTDFPMWDAVGEMKRFMEIDLTDREREAIFYGNACRILNL